MRLPSWLLHRAVCGFSKKRHFSLKNNGLLCNYQRKLRNDPLDRWQFYGHCMRDKSASSFADFCFLVSWYSGSLYGRSPQLSLPHFPLHWLSVFNDRIKLQNSKAPLPHLLLSPSCQLKNFRFTFGTWSTFDNKKTMRTKVQKVSTKKDVWMYYTLISKILWKAIIPNPICLENPMGLFETEYFLPLFSTEEYFPYLALQA